MIALQPDDPGVRQARLEAVKFCRQCFDEVVGERRDVFPAIPKRSGLQRKDIQSIK